MSFVSSKGTILCRLVNIELYKIFAIINRAIKGLHCTEHFHACTEVDNFKKIVVFVTEALLNVITWCLSEVKA